MDLDITSYLLGKNSSGGGTTINNQDITVTENGEYTAESGYTGLGTVTVNVPSNTPTNLPDLNTIATNFENNTLLTISNNRPTYTNNSITLYTPNASETNYVIVAKSGGYRVYWSSGLFQRQPFSTNPNDPVLFVEKPSNASGKIGSNYWVFGTKIDKYFRYYYSDTIADLDELITKMQTPNGLSYTAYTSMNYISYVGNLETGVYYSNAPFIDKDFNKLENVGILSYNETITVQS